MRGNPAIPVGADLSLGTIPAHAGEPRGRGGEVIAGGDYPRACGGTPCRQASKSRRPGLSPRMRGNRNDLRDYLKTAGTIPAHAGEPAVSARSGSAGQDYPRACGGTRGSAFAGRGLPGLSPRMRGNLAFLPAGALDEGTIPAHAGEPGGTAGTARFCGDYPRACGGTYRLGYCWDFVVGLSPRMRGNHDKLMDQDPNVGTIPAHAGEPVSSR